MQRLYLLSLQGRDYLTGKFMITLAPDFPDMPGNDIKKATSILLENKVDVVEMAEINNLDDLLRFELYHTLKTDLLIRKCKHCGEFFIVRGRIDTEYCGRQKPGETKPCSVIGATRNYWDGKMEDPIYVAFQKAYKRNHSRQRVGKMTQSEFYEWSEEARRKRSECEAGQLSLDEWKCQALFSAVRKAEFSQTRKGLFSTIRKGDFSAVRKGEFFGRYVPMRYVG
jgi:hypothetical protein